MPEKILKTKICKHCNTNFEITDKDMEFYEKVSPIFVWKKYSIPDPNLCPDCRQQRRLNFRNERKLYKRKCDATGKDIISIYSPDKVYKVYDNDYWCSDKWDPIDYWRDFDFSKSFFEQFDELEKDVPRLSLYIGATCENCDYTNQIYNCTDCYLTFSCQNDRDCLYWKRLIGCDDCVDCLLCLESSNIYWSVDISKSNNCQFSLSLENCSDVSFSYDCEWCNDCFLCNNLKNKNYYILNKKYSKDEYFEKKKELQLLWYDKLMELYKDIRKKSINKHLNITSSQNVLWNYVKNSNNCSYVSDCSDIEFVKFWQFVTNIKNCYDLDYSCCISELSYEITTGWVDMYNCLFSVDIWPNVQNTLYSDSCSASSNLFWCIWLRNKSYCIFNKQYTKEEYEKLVPKILEHMMKTWEWGEFFPANISPFGYNESVAEEYFPLNKEQIKGQTQGTAPTENCRGEPCVHPKNNIFNRSNYETPFQKVEKIIPANKLPSNIKDIPDDILNWAIECEVTNKPFRIVKAELDFYRKHNIPIPKRHPDQRHLDRMNLRNPKKLYDRKCDKCWINMKTNYAPESEEIVYCEECYIWEVY